MKLKEVLRQRLRRRLRARPFHPQTECKLLNMLPPELLQYIASFLSTSSASSLALCSWATLATIGTRYFEHLNAGRWESPEPYLKQLPKWTEQEEERQDFFLSLDKETSVLIFCFYCQRLHRPDRRPVQHLADVRREKGHCFSPDMELIRYIFGCPGLTFARIAMPLKLHRLGLDPNPSMAPLSSSVTIHRQDSALLRRNTVKIISGSFYLRSQHWLLLPPAENGRPTLPSKFYRLQICYHVWVTDYTCSPHKLMEGLQCQLSHYKAKKPCDSCAGIQICRYCLMEYEISLAPVKNQFALVVTAWHNFGELRSPFDYDWRSRVTHDFRRHHISGDIKLRFEGRKFAPEVGLATGKGMMVGYLFDKSSRR